jgi:hypothetical protein
MRRASTNSLATLSSTVDSGGARPHRGDQLVAPRASRSGHATSGQLVLGTVLEVADQSETTTPANLHSV